MPPTLPPEARESDEALIVGLDPTSRRLALVLGTAASIAGLAVLIVLGLPSGLAGLVGIGVGGYLLASRDHRIVFDPTGARELGGLRRRHLPWERIAAIRSDRRVLDARTLGRPRRIAGLTVSWGPSGGGRRRTRIGRRVEVPRLLVAPVDGGRPMGIDLNEAGERGAAAIVQRLAARRWAPQDVRLEPGGS
jgi:hypothetical protein